MEYATHITGEYIIAYQETKLFKSEEKLQLLIVKKIIQTFWRLLLLPDIFAKLTTQSSFLAQQM